MSVFERVTRALVQELDSGGDMIPVKSMVDAGSFKCCYLVRGRKRFWGWRFYKTDLTLEDILDKEQDKGLFARMLAALRGEKTKFQVHDNTDSELTAKFPEEKFAVKYLRSCNWKATVTHRKITQNYLEFLVNKRLKQRLPTSFRTISPEENVYLVTETLETQQEEILQAETQYKIWSSFLKGIKGENKSQNKITIPANVILAYRKKQLIFKEGRMSIAFWTEEKRSFQGGMTVRRLQATGNLQEQVQDTAERLQELNEKERKNMLCSITSCATKEGGLEDLEQRVSDVLISDETHTEGPAGPLICSLHNNAGCLVKARAEAILELLDALIELSEKSKYVTEALENGTLSSLRDQVKSILQRNWGEQVCQDVSRDPEARIFCALYVASSLLLQLSSSNKSICVCS